MTEEELKAQAAEAAKKAEEEAAAKAAAEAEAAKEKAAAQTIEELPEHLREYVRGLRREAASYRTSANELKVKLAAKDADSESKLAAAEAMLAEHAALKEQAELSSAAEKLGIPAGALALLNPKATAEERVAALASVAGNQRRQVIVDGGLSSRRDNSSHEPSGGAEMMRELIKNRRR